MGPSLRRFVAARLDRASYLGLHLTIGLVVTVLALWALGAVIEAVLDAERLVRWDDAAARWMHAHATPAVSSVMHAITSLGAPMLLLAIALGGTFVLFQASRHVVLGAWLAAFAGSAALDELLKLAVHRARPPFGARFVHGASYGFPSGHAMGAIVGYGMVLYVWLSWRRRGRAATIAATIATAVVVLAIAVSRVYIGVHYPSDVVGGLAGGAAWLAVCITGANVALGRGRSESSVD